MVALNERYVLDKDGKPVSVLLDLDAFRAVLAELEELDDLRAFDAAEASGDAALPFADAMAEIERERSQR